MNNKLIAPSLLSADFSKLQEEVKLIQAAKADWLHLDVMDGHFVDDLTFGPKVVESLKPYVQIPLDAHLMVSEPEKWVMPFKKAGCDYLTFHEEACSDSKKLIQEIKQAGMKAGMSIKPQTPAEALFPFLKDLDLILIMSVEPGKGGQAFLKSQADKIRIFKDKIRNNQNPSLISVDGGINPQTIKYVQEADVFVAGTSIFKQKDYKKAIEELRSSV